MRGKSFRQSKRGDPERDRDSNTAPNHASGPRTPPPEASATAPSASDDSEPPGASATVWSVPTENVEALLAHRAFKRRLTSGLVFLQNKRPMADLLLTLASSLHPRIRFATIRESQGDVGPAVESLCLKQPSRAREASAVTVLDSDVVPSRVPGMLSQLAAAPGLRHGVWVRGYVRDMHPAQLRLFDVMFLFDMSDGEMETVRSSIPIPLNRSADLRKQVSGSGQLPEALLVFTAGTDRATGTRLQEVRNNPALLPLRGTVRRIDAHPTNEDW